MEAGKVWYLCPGEGMGGVAIEVGALTPSFMSASRIQTWPNAVSMTECLA